MTIIDTGDTRRLDVTKQGERAVLFTVFYGRGDDNRVQFVDASGVGHDEEAARAWIELAVGDSYDAEPVRLRGWSTEWVFDKGRWRQVN